MSTLSAARSAALRTPIARQPIWTVDGTLVGHEYLYRSAGGQAPGVDRWRDARQDAATASVLATVFRPGFQARLGKPAFVNVTRSFVVGGRVLPALPDALVLEVVESVPADGAVLAGLARLRASGFRIAIDDFVGHDDQVAMLPFADLVKIDLRDLERIGAGLLARARSHGAKLVAERVETTELMRRSVSQGFELLQGDVLGPATLTDVWGPAAPLPIVPRPARVPGS